MENTQAQAADTSATAAADAAGATASQVDLGDASLEQLNNLFEKGSVELPPAPSGEGTGTATATDTKVDPPAAAEPPKEGVTPPTESAAAPVVQPTAEEKAAADKAAADAAAAGGTVTELTAEEKARQEAEAAAEHKEIEGIQRPRLKDPVDQQIAAVKKAADLAGSPISWAEAERRVKGDPAPKTEEVVEQTPDLATQVTTLSTEVQAMKDRLTELGAAEGLVTPEITKLNLEFAEKSADLKLLQRDLAAATDREAREQEQSKTASETARAASRAKAVERWPDAGDDKTELGKAVAKRIAEMKDPKHPDHAILYADSAPMQIVRDVAEELGIAPVVKAAATPPATTTATPPPTTTPPVVPPRVVVSPAPGNRTAVLPVPPAEDVQKTVEYLKSDEATLEDLDAFFNAGSLPKTLQAITR